MRKPVHVVKRRHVWRLDISDLDLSELTVVDLMKEIGWALEKARGEEVELIAQALDTGHYRKACSLIANLLETHAVTKKVNTPATITQLDAHTWFVQAHPEVRARINREMLERCAMHRTRTRESIKLELIRDAMLTERKRPKL